MDSSTVSQGTDATLTLIGLFLAAAAVALAWFLYRLERLAARRREIDAAVGVLKGVRRGMVGRDDDDVGWAAHYFETVYTQAPDDPEVMTRVAAARQAVQNRSFSEVWSVPTAPLEEIIAAAAAGEGLISEETIFTANVGLWRIGVFNQIVRMQTEFNTRHLAELYDEGLPQPRRDVLAQVASAVSELLHRHGVGEANIPTGWYARFVAAVQNDIAALTDLRARGFVDYRGRPWLAVGDIALGLLPIAALALVIADVT